MFYLTLIIIKIQLFLKCGTSSRIQNKPVKGNIFLKPAQAFTDPWFMLVVRYRILGKKKSWINGMNC